MPLVGGGMRMLLCRCSVLFQPIKLSPHCLVTSRLAKLFDSHCGQYFTVRNNDSEYGLSPLTRGRPREGLVPKSWSCLAASPTSSGTHGLSAAPVFTSRTAREGRPYAARPRPARRTFARRFTCQRLWDCRCPP
jgi:hypothetical protein